MWRSSCSKRGANGRCSSSDTARWVMSRTQPGELVERGRQVLLLEAEAIARVARRLGPGFAAAVQLLARIKGRLIVSGIGKSGLIARKVASTFTSTGTPASFLHPADAVHGDLGLVGRDDAALLLSKSGASDELFALMEHVKRLGVPVIAVTGDPESVLARHADVVLDASVTEEACPETLAPTASTTAALALGDALAVALLEVKGFRREQFLDIPVGDVMTRTPKSTRPDELAGAAVGLMEQHGIMALPVLDGGTRVVGMVHLHDLMRAGVV